MKIIESLDLEVTTNILMLLSFVLLILTIIRKMILTTIKKKQTELVKEQYPHLSRDDLKFRETSIINYYKIYSKGFFSSLKLQYFLSYLLLMTLGIAIGCLYSYNYLGSYFCVALIAFYCVIICLTFSKISSKQLFWTNYLKEHPENPLMVVLFPKKWYKNIFIFSTALGICLLCVCVYTFLVVYSLHLQGF